MLHVQLEPNYTETRKIFINPAASLHHSLKEENTVLPATVTRGEAIYLYVQFTMYKFHVYVIASRCFPTIFILTTDTFTNE